MRQDIQVLDRVKSAYASLRPSERRVADYVLSDPDECTQCTISELAERVQVSQPTVVRFVQAMGFDGYRSFKYCLLRDRSGKSPQSPYFDPMGDLDLKPWDCLEDLPLKETRMAGGLLEDTLKSLSTQGLSRAVRMLATARTIDIYGVENSFTPASDLLTKLTYLGLNCRMHTDAMMNKVEDTFRAAGAQFVIQNLSQLPDLISALGVQKESLGTVVPGLSLCVGGEIVYFMNKHHITCKH